jgi:hypothetical protein
LPDRAGRAVPGRLVAAARAGNHPSGVAGGARCACASCGGPPRE